MWSESLSRLSPVNPLTVQRRLYIEPILAGDPIRSSVIGEVICSRSDKWKKGDIVFGDGEWAEFSVVSDHGPLTGKQM